MATDRAAEFYDTPGGAVAARLLGARMARLWPDAGGLSVLGVGFPSPYLGLWQPSARCCVSAVMEDGACAAWPATGRSLSCRIEGEQLPFPDLSFDRVVLVHGLECASSARRLLRESWRVLRDDGRLLVAVPNRTGWWAHLERTPFGQGQPFSSGQLGRLLSGAMFRVERRDTALYLPPCRHPLLLRAACALEPLGSRVAPRLAGVVLAEAVKEAFAVMPRRATRRRVVLAQAA